jgi:hypothetical protein
MVNSYPGVTQSWNTLTWLQFKQLFSRGFPSDSGYSATTWLQAQGTYARTSHLELVFDRTISFQFFSLARVRHNKNFILWALITTAVTYGSSQRGASNHVGLFFVRPAPSIHSLRRQSICACRNLSSSASTKPLRLLGGPPTLISMARRLIYLLPYVILITRSAILNTSFNEVAAPATWCDWLHRHWSGDGSACGVRNLPPPMIFKSPLCTSINASLHHLAWVVTNVCWLSLSRFNSLPK